LPTHLSEIKQTVTFIHIPDKDGNWAPNGTGFFVRVPVAPESIHVECYLVTAKHVLQNNGNYYPVIGLRLNAKDDSSPILPINLTHVNIYAHDDPDVDIALFPCLPLEERFEFRMIQDELIITQELIAEHDIGEGDDVYFTGLFTSHIGKKRMQPIIRFGKIALMSDEPVEWKITPTQPAKLLTVYLVECQSFGGNSGSPVFFQLSPLRRPGYIGTQFFLAGIMMGNFLHGSEVRILSNQVRLASVENIGIAAVTPASKLRDILYSKDLINHRAELLKSTPTLTPITIAEPT